MKAKKVIIVVLAVCNLFVFSLIARGVKPGCVAPTGSMAPTIKDWALILYAPAAEYAEKDIIVFTVEGELICHRIVEKEANTYRTKGDCEGMIVDPWIVANEQVRGKVLWIVNWPSSMAGRYISGSWRKTGENTRK